MASRGPSTTLTHYPFLPVGSCTRLGWQCWPHVSMGGLCAWHVSASRSSRMHERPADAGRVSLTAGNPKCLPEGSMIHTPPGPVQERLPSKKRCLLWSGVIASEAPESIATTASYCPAPCLATPPDDGYTAGVRHSHSSPSGLVPAPAHGGHRIGERRNALQCCCVRSATLASHACVRPCGRRVGCARRYGKTEPPAL
jgi:hypothetical protein